MVAQPDNPAAAIRAARTRVAAAAKRSLILWVVPDTGGIIACTITAFFRPSWCPMKKLNSMDLYDIRSQLSEEETIVQDTVARFVDESVLPIIGECFEHARFPAELVSQVAELGLLGSSIEGYDCAGLNAVCYGLICQELERCDSGLRSFVSVQSSLVMYPIHSYGSDEQKDHWLPRLARGEAIG